MTNDEINEGVHSEDQAPPYLQQNFYDRLAEAYQVKHADAVAEEANMLKPLFNSLSAYISDYDVSVAELPLFLNDDIVDWFKEGGHKAVSAQTLSALFSKIANDNGSLIRSGFAFTDSTSFKDFAENDCVTYYNGDGHTCYPSAAHLGKKQNMGFAQILRIGSDTRITLPVIGMDGGRISSCKDSIQQNILTQLEAIYRLTNHDWLHHMTLPVVGNATIAKAQNNTKIKDNLVCWNKAMIAPHESYKNGCYEAWAVMTHAHLLQRDEGGAMRQALDEKVADLCLSLQELAAAIPAVEAEHGQQGSERNAAYTELAYFTQLAATALSYVQRPDTALLTPLLDTLAQLMPLNDPDALTALCDVWHYDESAPADLTAQCIKRLTTSNSAAYLLEGNHGNAAFAQKAQGYTASACALMLHNYGLA
jgi:hypothetical protein